MDRAQLINARDAAERAHAELAQAVEATAPPASRGPCDLLERAPEDADLVATYLGGLTRSQLDRVWVGVVAEMLHEGAGVAVVVQALNVVRDRYRDPERTATGTDAPSVRPAERARGPVRARVDRLGDELAERMRAGEFPDGVWVRGCLREHGIDECNFGIRLRDRLVGHGAELVYRRVEGTKGRGLQYARMPGGSP